MRSPRISWRASPVTSPRSASPRDQRRRRRAGRDHDGPRRGDAEYYLGLHRDHGPTTTPGRQGPQDEDSDEEVSEDEAERALREKEEEQFKEAEEEIQEALKVLPELEQLVKSLKIDSTPEGLRIQIIDQEGLAMFPRGSSEMFEHTKKALGLVAKVIEKMPQDVSITGHTDATKFAGGRHSYTNWELSADRANASRRALIEFALNPDRLSRIVGAAEQEPYVSDDPDSPSNRRIAIVLLRGTGQLPDEKMEMKEEAQEQPQEEAALQ